MVIDIYSYYEKTCYIQSYGSDSMEYGKHRKALFLWSALFVLYPKYMVNMVEYSPGK